MRAAIYLFIFSACLVSCTPEKETSEEMPAAAAPEIEVQQTEAEPESSLVPIATDEALLATALLAAPEEFREGCTVQGYNMAGEFVTMKEGSNEFICLADDPRKEGFNAACYHQSLEPFMARGRALRAEGKTAQEIFDQREIEVKSGALSMGDPGATLHIYYGKETAYDPTTAKVAGAKYRYVVYLPFATAASTGLPEAPIAPNHPWIMNPGTHRAHIMVSPINE